MTTSSTGRSPTGISGLGRTVVYGRRRMPAPPARMIARFRAIAEIYGGARTIAVTVRYLPRPNHRRRRRPGGGPAGRWGSGAPPGGRAGGWWGRGSAVEEGGGRGVNKPLDLGGDPGELGGRVVDRGLQA